MAIGNELEGCLPHGHQAIGIWIFHCFRPEPKGQRYLPHRTVESCNTSRFVEATLLLSLLESGMSKFSASLCSLNSLRFTRFSTSHGYWSKLHALTCFTHEEPALVSRKYLEQYNLQTRKQYEQRGGASKDSALAQAQPATRSRKADCSRGRKYPNTLLRTHRALCWIDRRRRDPIQDQTRGVL